VYIFNFLLIIPFCSFLAKNQKRKKIRKLWNHWALQQSPNHMTRDNYSPNLPRNVAHQEKNHYIVHTKGFESVMGS